MGVHNTADSYKPLVMPLAISASISPDSDRLSKNKKKGIQQACFLLARAYSLPPPPLPPPWSLATASLHQAVHPKTIHTSQTKEGFDT